MLIIELINPHWLNELESDLCAHGGVRICANDFVFSGGVDTEWTVSAAALYLLRTLTQDHTKNHRVSEHVIPCCGFMMFDRGEGKDVDILGCSNGIDFEIKHLDSGYVLLMQGNQQTQVSFDEYRKSVFQFADAVNHFYEVNVPRRPYDAEDAQGYEAFWAEWKRRRYEELTIG